MKGGIHMVFPNVSKDGGCSQIIIIAVGVALGLFLFAAIGQMRPGPRFDIVVALATLAVYAANRFLMAFDAILPYEFTRFHLGDLCGAVLFCAYVNLISEAVRKRPLIDTVPAALVTAAGLCLAWEVVAPSLMPSSVADVLDCAAYAAGVAAYLLLRKAVLRQPR